MCGPIAAVGAFAAGSLLSVFAGQQQAQAQAAQLQQQAALAQNQAQLQQQQAKVAQQKAAADAAQAERQAQAVIGRQNAVSGVSGAMGDQGSFNDLFTSSVLNMNRDIYNITTAGEQQAAVYNNSSNALMYTANGYRAQADKLPGLALMTSVASIVQRGGSMFGSLDFGGGGATMNSTTYGSARPTTTLPASYRGWIGGGV